MASQKIALNVKETLEAKELLRQRSTSDGTVENLVRRFKKLEKCFVVLEKINRFF